MRKTNYLILLITLFFAFSCEMQNELTGFEDGDGNPWEEPLDEIPIPIGGGGSGSGGDDDDDDANTPTTTSTIITKNVCISKYALTTFTVNGYGNNINWSVTGDFATVNRTGNSITVFADDFFDGGTIVGTKTGFRITYIISECPPPTPCFSNATATISDEYIDGTLSEHDVVSLNIASNNWPVGTTYALKTIREDGTTANYAASTETIRRVSASLENPIEKVIITAKYGDCERGFIVTVDPAIPQKGYTSNGVYFGWKKFLKHWKFFYNK